MARDSFIFYRSFYEAIKEVPEDAQLQIYKAISIYALEQEEIELTGIARAIFSLVKPQLDANYKKYENGKQTKNKMKAKDKQNESKIETNVNENENVNVNVNDNENNNDNVEDSRVKGILNNWFKKGIKSVLEAEKEDANYKKSGNNQKTKSYNNYSQREDIDFNKLYTNLGE